MSEKGVRRRLLRRLAQGRASLTVMVAVTLINQLMLARGINYHFFLSAAMPYYISWTVHQLQMGAAARILAAVVTAGSCGVFLACWRLSCCRKGWLGAALGLYGLDTLALIVFAAACLQNPAACFLEILTHAFMLILLWTAVAAEGKFFRMRRRRSASGKIGAVSKTKQGS